MVKTSVRICEGNHGRFSHNDLPWFLKGVSYGIWHIALGMLRN